MYTDDEGKEPRQGIDSHLILNNTIQLPQRHSRQKKRDTHLARGRDRGDMNMVLLEKAFKRTRLSHQVFPSGLDAKRIDAFGVFFKFVDHFVIRHRDDRLYTAVSTCK